ncbi:helix-turn-helix domain-containing protein [Spirillospora sp. NPDC048911]|uniref:helix-turn-helix domain-containing protein n=1 Tax=Spirillospora sp. NPDC048911 TaxID=3364527 RepID=UPI0037113FF4
MRPSDGESGRARIGATNSGWAKVAAPNFAAPNICHVRQSRCTPRAGRAKLLIRTQRDQRLVKGRGAMPSAYIRRRQLAVELRKIRDERDLTVDGLARLIHQSPSKITRLENGQMRPDLHDILNMLETLDITGRQHDKVFQLAREAAEKGWWDRYGMSMGPRQKLAADLEHSAETIRSYDQTAMPGVLQSPEFITALIELDRCQGKIDYDPARMADARANRQRELLRPDGPSYEAVLDECVIHRLAVPPEAMATQLRRLTTAVSAEGRITVRILPHDARIEGGFLPKSSFHIYTFADPTDPAVVVVDGVTTDLVLTQRKEVARYTGMYDRLREAALSPGDSIAFLDRVADRLTEQAGSET